MKLTINNNDIRSLASLLKTKEVLVKDLKIDDIVIDDFSVWHVTEIRTEGGGELAGHTYVGDEDENGGYLPPEAIDGSSKAFPRPYTYTVIDPVCLK